MEIVKLAVTAGRIMLENGAETYRVEDTVNRILKHFEGGLSDSFVTTTGVFVTVDKADGKPVTMVKRVKNRTINLNKVALVNALSRKITSGEISLEDAFEELEGIDNSKPFHVGLKILASGVCCFCLTYTFGGRFWDSANSFVTGILLMVVLQFFYNKMVSNFLVNIIGGATVALSALILFNLGLGQNIDKIIIGSIMPLVPGVGITNAIRDVLEGDFLSGSSRIFDALIVALAIAAGVGTVMKIFMI